METCTRNAAQCMHCGDIIESRWGHDFQSCMCGSTFVDGGVGRADSICMRRGFVTYDECDELQPYDELSEYEDGEGI